MDPSRIQQASSDVLMFSACPPLQGCRDPGSLEKRPDTNLTETLEKQVRRYSFNLQLTPGILEKELANKAFRV